MANEEKRIPDEVVGRIYRLVDGDENPSTFQYLLQYGVGSAIPDYDVDMMGLDKEQIYQYCLENDLRWEDVLDRMPDDVLT